MLIGANANYAAGAAEVGGNLVKGSVDTIPILAIMTQMGKKGKLLLVPLLFVVLNER